MSDLHALLDSLLEIIVFHYTVITHDISCSVESLKEQNEKDITQLETKLSELIDSSTSLNDEINRPILKFILETLQCLSSEIYTNSELSEETIVKMKSQLFYFFTTLNKLSNMREDRTLTPIYDKKLHGFTIEKLHGFLGEDDYTVLGKKIVTQFNHILTVIDAASSDSVDGDELQPSLLKSRISQLFMSYQMSLEPIRLRSKNCQLQTELEASKQEVEQLRMENAALKTGSAGQPMIATQANPAAQSGRRPWHLSATPSTHTPLAFFQLPNVQLAAAMASALNTEKKQQTTQPTTDVEITTTAFNPDQGSSSNDEVEEKDDAKEKESCSVM